MLASKMWIFLLIENIKNILVVARFKRIVKKTHQNIAIIQYKPFTDRVTDSLTFLSPFRELVAKQEYFFIPSSNLTDLICKSPGPEVTAYLPAIHERVT